MTFAVAYTNTGADASGVTITVRLNARVRLLAASQPAGWVCGGASATVCTLPVGMLTIGASGTQVLHVRSVASTRRVSAIVSVARIRDDGIHGMDANPLNNADAVIVLASQTGSLARLVGVNTMDIPIAQQLTIALYWSAAADQLAPVLLQTMQITSSQSAVELVRALTVNQARVSGLSDGVLWAVVTDSSSATVLDSSSPLALNGLGSVTMVFLPMVSSK